MHRRSIIVSLFFLCTHISFLKADEVHFIKDDLKTALDVAHNEGKLIFIDFWASYCTPCKMMEEYTFSAETIAEKLNSAYVPLKVDIQSFDGYDLKTQYQITQLPTLIILDSKGHLVARFEESMGATTLLNVLEQYDQDKYRQRKLNIADNDIYNPVTEFSNANNKRVTPPVNFKPTEDAAPAVAKPNNYSTGRLTRTTTPAKKTKPAIATTERTASAEKKNTLIKVLLPPKGFTIKIGTYATDAALNSMYQKSIDKVSHTTQKIYVYNKNINGKMLHRLVIGQFATQQQAEDFKQAHDIVGLVLSFSVLK